MNMQSIAMHEQGNGAHFTHFADAAQSVVRS
jgi:hypothetical protein